MGIKDEDGARQSIVPVTLSAGTLAQSGVGTPDVEYESSIVDAEWVRRYPSRRRRQWGRWLLFVLKIAAGLALTYLFYIIPPESFPSPFQNWKNPVLVFLLICFIGKTLLDTFFYDHYQP